MVGCSISGQFRRYYLFGGSQLTTYTALHSGKICIEHALTPIPLFTIMENTIYVIQGLTLLTESLDPPKIISRYLPVNFDTISRATLLFENLRFLVSAWDTNVQC